MPSIAEIPEVIPLFAGKVFERRPGDLVNPNREPMETLDLIRDDIGSYAFHAQYQQNPSDGENDFLKIADLHLVEALPEQRLFVRRALSVDTAAKDGPRCDYSVIMAFGWHAHEERWYLLDIQRGRMDYTELKAAIRRQR